MAKLGVIGLGFVVVLGLAMAWPSDGRAESPGRNAPAAANEDDAPPPNELELKSYEQGRYSEAVPLAERALAIKEKPSARTILPPPRA